MQFDLYKVRTGLYHRHEHEVVSSLETRNRHRQRLRLTQNVKRIGPGDNRKMGGEGIMELKIGPSTIELVRGDITRIAVDGIVNAANSGLRGGGGVDGAIHRAGGRLIMEECRRIGHCPPGEAVATTAGNLPAKRVIHTVGPIWRGGERGEENILENAYRSSLRRGRA